MAFVNIELDDKIHKMAKKTAIDRGINLKDYLASAIIDKVNSDN